MTPERNAVFNVPIRTVMIQKNLEKAVYGTGGGITWDSTTKGEYEELQTKAKLLTEKRPEFKLLETMRLENGEIPLLVYHINRLSQTADYFSYPIDIEKVREEVEKEATIYGNGIFKLRLLVSRNNETSIQVNPLMQKVEEVNCTLAESPVDEQNPFLFHKTTHREVYEAHQKESFFSTLLWNTKEELTEFLIGNVVVKIDGGYFTPPVSSGLLAGTFRQKLIDEGIIKEQVLYKYEAEKFDEVWLVNGVRGWLKVNLTI